MKQRLPLHQFSEPQAVLILLGWLRLITTGLLLAFCVLAEYIDIQAIKPMLDWQLIVAGTGIVAGLSLYTWTGRRREIPRVHLVVMLLLDISVWAVLVYASGGPINPAISYLLVLLSIAALSLSGVQAASLAAITIALYAWIMNAPQPHAHHGHIMGWHLWGMWVLFMLNAVIMLVVITLLGRALRDKDKAIAAYREETVRNEQLVSMGTMAANIAHELGTPLSTIGLLLEDAEVDEKPAIQQQLERCRKALQQLKSTTHKLQETRLVDSTELLRRWVHECQLLQPDANIECQDRLQQDVRVSPLLEQAMLALLNNAVEAARSVIILGVYRRSQDILFDIHHDGPAVSEDLLRTLGRQVVESSKEGLGLGYYLANASIERLGGSLQISNQKPGVLTRVQFPAELLEAVDAN